MKILSIALVAGLLSHISFAAIEVSENLRSVEWLQKGRQFYTDAAPTNKSAAYTADKDQPEGTFTLGNKEIAVETTRIKLSSYSDGSHSVKLGEHYTTDEGVFRILALYLDNGSKHITAFCQRFHLLGPTAGAHLDVTGVTSAFTELALPTIVEERESAAGKHPPLEVGHPIYYKGKVYIVETITDEDWVLLREKGKQVVRALKASEIFEHDEEKGMPYRLYTRGDFVHWEVGASITQTINRKRVSNKVAYFKKIKGFTGFASTKMYCFESDLTRWYPVSAVKEADVTKT